MISKYQIFFFIFYIFLLITKCYAGAYISSGVSVNYTNNLKIESKNIEDSFPSFTSNFSQTELVCKNCSGELSSGGGHLTVIDVYKTTTINNNYLVNDNKIELVSKLKKQGTLSYNVALGWEFLNNIRIEAEFRTINFKNELNNLFTNITNSQNISYSYSCSNSLGNVVDNCSYSSQNQEESNTYNAYGDLSNLMSSNGINYNSSSTIRYYLINFLYGLPVTNYIGFYTGGGLGIGNLNLKINTDLPLNVNRTASSAVYQYKVGTYFNIPNNKHIRFLLSLTRIAFINKITLTKDLTIKPITQSSVDFNIMLMI